MALDDIFDSSHMHQSGSHQETDGTLNIEVKRDLTRPSYRHNNWSKETKQRWWSAQRCPTVDASTCWMPSELQLGNWYLSPWSRKPNRSHGTQRRYHHGKVTQTLPSQSRYRRCKWKEYLKFSSFLSLMSHCHPNWMNMLRSQRTCGPGKCQGQPSVKEQGRKQQRMDRKM